MSITWFLIGAESGQARSSTQDENWQRSYTRHYRAQTDDNAIGPGAVRAACPVALGATYSYPGETDTGVYAHRITATEDTSVTDGRHWIVTIEYGPYNINIFHPENPIDAQPRIAFTTTRFQVPAVKDIDGNPVENSAEDPFDPPVMIDQARPFMTITRNEASFSPMLTHDYKDALNDATWFGCPALCWKVLDISGAEAFDKDGNIYWEVHYEFELNPDTWVIPVQDRGFRQFDSTAHKVKIRDSNGREVDVPWPLNADGSAKTPGAEAEEILFHIYKEKDFTAFNLDTFYTFLVDNGLLT